MSNYIYSTCPQDYAFAVWQLLPDGSSKAIRHILVKGGAQLAVQAGAGFHTPLGVVTKVSDEELDLLRKDWSFNHYVSQGFMHIDSNKIDVEKAAGDMNIDVPGAPISESDILDIGAPDGVEIKVYDDDTTKKRIKK